MAEDNADDKDEGKDDTGASTDDELLPWAPKATNRESSSPTVPIDAAEKLKPGSILEQTLEAPNNLEVDDVVLCCDDP